MSDQMRYDACPDCDGLSRREFMETTAAGLAAASLPVFATPATAEAKPKRSDSETLVQQLFESLNDEQKAVMAFSFDDPLRSEVDNNWHITKTRVGTHFNKDQQQLIQEIFLGLHSPEYAEKVLGQVAHDSRADGLQKCSVALFGQPGSGKFEFVLTGRHVTRRCDGDSVDGAAFGGPIFYGHAARGFNEPPNHPGNVYWYQAVRANKLFQALDGKQRQQALRADAPEEQGTDTVKLSGKTADLAGLPVSEMTKDQKELARKVMSDVLAPFREKDAEESMKLIEAGGFDNLHMSYYKNMDIGNDGVWDVWQIEGPSMLWYFRGAPHVHTWVHIRQPA